MGTAHILVKKILLANLLLNYSDQIIVTEASAQDHEGNEYLCNVMSRHLPSGYNGMQFVVLKQWEISFKPDTDT